MVAAEKMNVTDQSTTSSGLSTGPPTGTGTKPIWLNSTDYTVTYYNTDILSTGDYEVPLLDTRDVRLVVGSLLIVVSILIVIGSGSVVMAMVKYPWLRTNTHFLLLSLSIVFLIDGAVAQPVVIYTYFKQDITPVSSSICSFLGYINYITGWLVMLHIMVINVERYVSIQYPLRYQVLVTVRTVCGVIVIVWLVGIISGALLVSFLTSHGRGILCFRDPHNGEYAWLMATLGFWLPFIVVCLVYVRIYAIVRTRHSFAHRDSETTSPRQSKAIFRIMAGVLGVRLVGFAPMTIVIPWMS